MTAPHFFAASVEADRITLTGADARHAVRSLRLRPGEEITVSDGAGAVVTARVVEARAALVAEVVSRRAVPPPRPLLRVLQALPKSGKLEPVVRKLTEVGVSEIVPFRAARSVVRWDSAKAAANLARLRAVAREASMQSRRAWLARVGEVARLEDLPPGGIVLHEEAAERLGAVLPPAPPDEVTLVVGPEGGFDPGEVAALAAGGARSVSLGPSVLRTETAGLVAAILVLAKYGVIG